MRLLGIEIVGRDSATASRRSSTEDAFWQGISTATRSGVVVTPSTAVQVAAVNAAVRVISETIASLPLILYRRLKDGGKERALDHSSLSYLALKAE
jgi:phage portal protein BeeE